MHTSQKKISAGLLVRVGGATEKSFKKMKFLEVEEEEENIAHIGINDEDDNYDNTDLLCEQDDGDDYNLCSGCDENLTAHLVQPGGYLIRTNCVKKPTVIFSTCSTWSTSVI